MNQASTYANPAQQNKSALSANAPARQGITLLIRSLNDDVRLSELSFERGPTGSAVVQHGGHVRGVWHARRGRYSYTPAGHSTPEYYAEDAHAAVEITLRAAERLAA